MQRYKGAYPLCAFISRTKAHKGYDSLTPALIAHLAREAVRQRRHLWIVRHEQREALALCYQVAQGSAGDGHAVVRRGACADIAIHVVLYALHSSYFSLLPKDRL